MPDPTPGQVCYKAFDAAFPADRFVRCTWDEQAPAVQRAWEAAAQAVRADGLRHARAVVRHWNEFGPEYGFAEAVHALETWLKRQQGQPQEDPHA